MGNLGCLSAEHSFHSKPNNNLYMYVFCICVWCAPGTSWNQSEILVTWWSTLKHHTQSLAPYYEWWKFNMAFTLAPPTSGCFPLVLPVSPLECWSLFSFVCEGERESKCALCIKQQQIPLTFNWNEPLAAYLLGCSEILYSSVVWSQILYARNSDR